MLSIEISGDKTGIIFSFRGKNQLPLFMIIKEFFDENGEVEFAKVLFEIEGRKCKKSRLPEGEEYIFGKEAILQKDIKILENLASRTRPIAEDLETAVCSIDEQLAIRNLIAKNKELESALNNSVSKDEIKEILNKLIKEADYRTTDNSTGRVHFYKEPVDYQIEIIQKLLNKGE